MAREQLAVIVLTFNCADVIEKTLRAALRLSPMVITIDSHSTDRSPEIASKLGCQVHQRPFKHYADQRNWAIETFRELADWQLHVDADEVLDEAAIRDIGAALADPGSRMGFMLRRRTYFMGRPLRFGGTTTWHLRLFRAEAGRCEDRLYDQHFLCDHPIGKLRHGFLHDMNVGSLTEWTQRHNRWSDMEASELCREEAAMDQVEARLSHDPRERRRLYKAYYYRAPPLWRTGGYFLFRYLVLGGFVDGRVGFIYTFLQAFWFRVLVDAKLLERRLKVRAPE